MYEVHLDRSIGLTTFSVTLLLASAIDFGTFWALGSLQLQQPARTAVALLPLPGNITLIWMVLQRIRRLDEFQKRVHFEAVVVAFLSTGVAVFVYGFLQKAQVAGPLNMGLVWAFMLIFYGFGYIVARNHYK